MYNFKIENIGGCQKSFGVRNMGGGRSESRTLLSIYFLLDFNPLAAATFLDTPAENWSYKSMMQLHICTSNSPNCHSKSDSDDLATLLGDLSAYMQIVLLNQGISGSLAQLANMRR